MSSWDSFMYGHRHHDNTRSINEGIESVLRTLDNGTYVSVGINCVSFGRLQFLNYVPEEDLAFFDGGLIIKASKINFLRT